jgi:hypothetical protein
VLDALKSINPLILAISLVVLVVAVGMTLTRGRRLQRERSERLARAHEDIAGGETSVLPLPELANAVEVLDLEELLAGEDAPVAAAARRLLEEPTDISSAPDTFFPLPKRPQQAPAARPAAAAAAAAVAVAVAPPASSLPSAGEGIVPVRELALAWFEARGYRPSAASPAVRPIELVLRHRQDASRAYAFVVELEPVGAARAAALAEHAKSIGLSRLLVAAEFGVDPDTRRQFRRQGVRLVDQAEMQREFDKLEISVAAKIIAVARGRSRARAGKAR